jgi:hypothetical protein
VLSENNNSQDLGAYTFKAGPAPPAPAGPPARLLARPPPPRCRACGAGLGELDLFSPQALQEERKAEDCSPSRLARQVGSEVSTSGQRWQQHRLLR